MSLFSVLEIASSDIDAAVCRDCSSDAMVSVYSAIGFCLNLSGGFCQE